MSTTGSGHKPENLAVGAVFTTLSFFCVALVGALGKAAGQHTSTAVVVLFQNLICLVVIISGGNPRRPGIAANRQDRPACLACRHRNRLLVRAVCGNHDDAADQRGPAHL